MKRTVSRCVMIFAAAVLTQACASSHQSLTFEPGSIDTSTYVRKVDQFVVIADGSLSMADRSHGQRKLGISEGLMVSLNQSIPSMGYEGGLRTFGRGLCKSDGKTVSIIDLGDYIESTYGDGVARYQCANGTSPLNLALDAAGTDMSNHSVPSAVVIVSDGLHMSQKEVAAAEALKSAFGENITIYAIQIGDMKKGRALLEQVASAGGGYVKSASELTSATAMAGFVIDVFLWPDDDGDGVPNHLDKCPDTPAGVKVDTAGCPLDSDGDGVPDYLDKCPGTPKGVAVDATGCPIDSDGDGVPDYLDKCPGTPRGAKVDAKGCPVDSDGDGVPDYLDKCPGTPRGVPVDKTGCPIKGIEVLGDEWMVRGKVLFALNKATIRPEAAEVLLKVANFLKKNPQYMVEIQGNTDNTGAMGWNMQLSQMRADAVKAYLVSNGVASGRLTTTAFGPNEPIAPNNTAEGRARNRRVDFKPTER
jgi:outer membrane protein OmpA-like peptidoglycan-associated protein